MKILNNIYRFCALSLEFFSHLSSRISKLLFGQAEKTAEKVEKVVKGRENPIQTPSSTAIYPIGIDLGTTNSCVAVYKEGKVIVIPDENGHRTTPSLVAFDGDAAVVGRDAQKTEDPENTLHSTKRFIGRKYEDVTSQVKVVPYTVSKDEEGNPVFHVKDKTVTPEKAATEILIKMKRIGEKHLGTDIKKAVITVPAYFNEKERQATRTAAEKAGIEVLSLLGEPTAASIAYGLDLKVPRTIVVYDLGGGTFDITLLNIVDGIFEVLSTNGDTNLGGNDFDQAIVEWIINQLKDQFDATPKALELIRRAAQKAKVDLSNQESTTIEFSLENQTYSLLLTREMLNSICTPLVKRTIEPCLLALKDAGLSVKDVSEAVLVGGMTRMPLVQQMVQKALQCKINTTTVNPDEAVAIGAAHQAANILGSGEMMILIDVNPLTVGIETEGGLMSPLINRNTHIPAKRVEIFSTSRDNQEHVEVKIYQGESELTSRNTQIGSFLLEGLVPAPRGETKIEVTFDMDSNGILRVTAKDLKTGKEQKVRIKSKSQLTDAKIEEKVEEAKTHAAEDQARAELIKARSVAQEILEELRKIQNSDELEPLINELEVAIKTSDLPTLKEKMLQAEEKLLSFLNVSDIPLVTEEEVK